jgi:hypothetical protein
MKYDNPKLITLWAAASLVVLVGIIASIKSVTGLSRQAEIWQQKSAARHELVNLLNLSKRHTAAVEAHKAWPVSPVPLQDLISSTLPGIVVSPLISTEQPSAENWTTRRISFSMTDVPGASLEKFFVAAATSRPPWSVEECTLIASTSSGRLAKVELVMTGVERKAVGTEDISATAQ